MAEPHISPAAAATPSIPRVARLEDDEEWERILRWKLPEQENLNQASTARFLQMLAIGARWSGKEEHDCPSSL